MYRKNSNIPGNNFGFIPSLVLPRNGLLAAIPEIPLAHNSFRKIDRSKAPIVKLTVRLAETYINIGKVFCSYSIFYIRCFIFKRRDIK